MQAGLLVMMLVGGVLPVGVAQAATPGSVVINEVAWAGSADAANDEWIELYNTTGASVDLSGWKLQDDGADAFTFPAGAGIAAHGYLLIEDAETVVSNVTADYIYNMSLANTGDALVLVDGGAVVIDTVNGSGSGGAWYAGSSTTFATMERVDGLVGDFAGNFAASTGGTGALASGGSAIIGTPRAINSVSVPAANQPMISASFGAAEASVAQTVQLSVDAAQLSDLFAYGMRINYDPAVLELVGVNAGTFLSDNGAVATSFQSGLVAGTAGDLLVAEARTIDPKIGVNGGGKLFTADFTVIGGEGTAAVVTFAVDSFVSSTSGDISAGFQSAGLNIVTGTVESVTNLQVAEGAGRYQIKLTWNASVSAPDHYRVERKDAHGQWQVLAGITALEFTDEDGVVGGGNIVPNYVYQYRVSAVKGAAVSDPIMISAQDSRGIKGDNNRSDLIDGRDLERLALHFAETDAAGGFEPLVDTTYDAMINGSDLIDIGAAFAQKYL